MDFIAATNNAGKMAEMRRILTKMGHTVRSQQEADVDFEPEETGDTFAENARIKAKAIANITGLPTIADDSGLCVDGLLGAPGVRSARYCGHHGDDEANNDKLLKDLGPVPAARRTARFVSCVCVYLPKNYDGNDGPARNMVCEGVCPGEIGFMRMGENGFGYDSLFIPTMVGTGPNADDVAPNKQRRTYAQLSAAEKDAISHRGMAMREMEQLLPHFLNNTLVEGEDGQILGVADGPADMDSTDDATRETELVWQEQAQELFNL